MADVCKAAPFCVVLQKSLFIDDRITFPLEAYHHGSQSLLAVVVQRRLQVVLPNSYLRIRRESHSRHVDRRQGIDTRQLPREQSQQGLSRPLPLVYHVS